MVFRSYLENLLEKLSLLGLLSKAVPVSLLILMKSYLPMKRKEVSNGMQQHLQEVGATSQNLSHLSVSPLTVKYHKDPLLYRKDPLPYRAKRSSAPTDRLKMLRNDQ